METSGTAHGWRAMLAENWETDGSLYVVTYCPNCYDRKFQDPLELNLEAD